MRDGNHQVARKLITDALTKNKKNGHGWLVAAEIEAAAGNAGLVNLLLRRGIEVRDLERDNLLLHRVKNHIFLHILTNNKKFSVLQITLSYTEPLVTILLGRESSTT